MAGRESWPSCEQQSDLLFTGEVNTHGNIYSTRCGELNIKSHMRGIARTEFCARLSKSDKLDFINLSTRVLPHDWRIVFWLWLSLSFYFPLDKPKQKKLRTTGRYCLYFKIYFLWNIVTQHHCKTWFIRQRKIQTALLFLFLSYPYY